MCCEIKTVPSYFVSLVRFLLGQCGYGAFVADADMLIVRDAWTAGLPAGDAVVLIAGNRDAGEVA